jgi:hypothetical protein
MAASDFEKFLIGGLPAALDIPGAVGSSNPRPEEIPPSDIIDRERSNPIGGVANNSLFLMAGVVLLAVGVAVVVTRS